MRTDVRTRPSEPPTSHRPTDRFPNHPVAYTLREPPPLDGVDIPGQHRAPGQGAGQPREGHFELFLALLGIPLRQSLHCDRPDGMTYRFFAFRVWPCGHLLP